MGTFIVFFSFMTTKKNPDINISKNIYNAFHAWVYLQDKFQNVGFLDQIEFLCLLTDITQFLLITLALVQSSISSDLPTNFWVIHSLPLIWNVALLSYSML